MCVVLPLWYSLEAAWHCIALLCVVFLNYEWLCTEAPCTAVWATGTIIVIHYFTVITGKYLKLYDSDESLPPSLYVSFHSPLGSQSLWNPWRYSKYNNLFKNHRVLKSLQKLIIKKKDYRRNNSLPFCLVFWSCQFSVQGRTERGTRVSIKFSEKARK